MHEDIDLTSHDQVNEKLKFIKLDLLRSKENKL